MKYKIEYNVQGPVAILPQLSDTVHFFFMWSISELLKSLSIIETIHAEEKADPPKYPWSHLGLFSSYDHARFANRVVTWLKLQLP